MKINPNRMERSLRKIQISQSLDRNSTMESPSLLTLSTQRMMKKRRRKEENLRKIQEMVKIEKKRTLRVRKNALRVRKILRVRKKTLLLRHTLRSIVFHPWLF